MGPLTIQHNGQARAISALTMIDHASVRVEMEPDAKKSGMEMELELELMMKKMVLCGDVKELEQWLRVRPMQRINRSKLLRLGFFGGDGGGAVPLDDRDYEIKRVVFASGKDKRLVGTGYLASDFAKGGPHTFWPIKFRTIRSHRVAGHPDLLEVGSEIESDIEVRPGTHTRPSCTVEIIYNSLAEAAFMDALDKWCTGNPDKFFTLSCPGHRGASHKASDFHVKEVSTFVRAAFGQCLRAATANAIHALSGPDQALAMLQLGPISGNSLSNLGSWIEQRDGRYRLQKVKITGNFDEEEWLMCQREGIFLARLHGIDSTSEEIDHVVVIDASRKLVFDCIETHAMRFESNVLDSCVGDGFQFLCISELRKLVLQPVGKKANKACRKKSVEAQRERKRLKNQEQKTFTTSSRGGRAKRRVTEDEDA